MKKQLTALAVSCSILLSSVTAFAASSFTDLNEFHAWAEPQIEEMTTLGIIKGYTDGSFRPDRAITKTEALVLISRAAGYITEGYDAFKASAYEAYKDVVDEYNTPYPNEVAFLLYKGVLTKDDLASYIASDRADSSLLRYEMAILLTKLMRAEDSVSKGSVTLTYSDAGEVPYAAAPYVDYVTNTSLMQGVYDPEYPNEVYFKPYGSVTRAQMAVLLHRVLEKLDVSVSYYTVIGRNADSNAFTYRDEEGKTTILPVKNGVNLMIDGYPGKTVSYVTPGAKMALFKINDTLVDIEIVNEEEYRWDGIEMEEAAPTLSAVEGTVTTIILGEDCSVIVNDVEYTLSAAATIYVNHVASTVYDLRVGHNVKLEFAGNKVIMIYATSPAGLESELLTTEGTITKLNVTSRYIYLEVENKTTGLTSEKALYIETGAAIFNGISGQSIDFLSLEVDDHIVATGTLKSDGNFYASKIIVR